MHILLLLDCWVHAYLTFVGVMHTLVLLKPVGAEHILLLLEHLVVMLLCFAGACWSNAYSDSIGDCWGHAYLDSAVGVMHI